MTPESDPAFRLEALAACAGLALNSLRRARRVGKIPPPDAVVRRACVWKLSTIRAWNPTVADRCARLIELEPIPPMAA